MDSPSAGDAAEAAVVVRSGAVSLPADLSVPKDARAIVLFAHGSGSSRHSPRNRYVAGALRQAGLATLLIDLLTEEEERYDQKTGAMRFDIELLADRLMGATDWLLGKPQTRGLCIGYFGASTGVAAALVAATERRYQICAIVSRGGRPDLAGSALARVQAPTLLIVGGDDYPVIPLNKEAIERLAAPEKRLEIVPGATHLFEEPGALECVARLAAEWFQRHIAPTEAH
jgi:dienelactone hydrolase